MKRFALIGAAGYIAPRHMEAILATGHDLVAVTDPSDSVGVIDTYFPDAAYFKEFERFDRYLDKLRQEGTPVDYLTVCSPNYLHDAHCRFGLRSGMEVICEKPLVLNPWNLARLQQVESETGLQIHNILQLRLHQDIMDLKKKVDWSPGDKKYEVALTYVVPRGKWYFNSWKGDTSKSGGITSNIGVHFFDMLLWVFGAVEENHVYKLNEEQAQGLLILEQARVKWSLSLLKEDLPFREGSKNRSYRSLTVDGSYIDFTQGFEGLHRLSYERIVEGESYGTEDVKPTIELLHKIRNAKLETDNKIKTRELPEF